MDMRREVEITTQLMKDHFPPSKKSNGVSYEDIAQIWHTKIALLVHSFAHYGNDGGIQIPVRRLRDNFSFKYNYNKRWWDWFVTNRPLYHLLSKGNNFVGNSKGVPMYTREQITQAMSPEEILEVYTIEKPADAVDDIIWIDIDSLKNYIKNSKNLLNKPKSYSDRVAQYIPHAQSVLSLAQAYDQQQVCELTGKIRWALPQNYKDSDWGRRYYTGAVALQNKPSPVRAASLGRCWEVDINSSVYRFYKSLATDLSIPTPMLDLLLTDKLSFRRELASTLQNISTSQYFILKLVKQSITSLGFGARDGAYSAVSEIIKNTEDRQRFTQHAYWTGLKAEAAQITQAVREHFPEEIKHFRATESKKFSMNRFMAYFYQMYETKVMQELWQQLELADRQPVLWVHDCIYTLRDPRHNGGIMGIEFNLKTLYNPHLKFDVTEYDDYDYVSEQVDIDAQQHAERIAQQEQIAQQKYGNPNKPSPQEQLQAMRWTQALTQPQTEYKPQEPYPGYFEEYYKDN